MYKGSTFFDSTALQANSRYLFFILKSRMENRQHTFYKSLYSTTHKTYGKLQFTRTSKKISVLEVHLSKEFLKFGHIDGL